MVVPVVAPVIMAAQAAPAPRQAATVRPPRAPITCHACGEDGHIAPNCDDSSAKAIWQAQKDAAFAARDARSRGGHRGGGRGGRGDGGGRGYQDRGDGHGRGYQGRGDGHGRGYQGRGGSRGRGGVQGQ